MDVQRDRSLTPSTTGSVLHGATGYDLLIWLVTLGRLEHGESALDVGGGTRTLAIAAARHVEPIGTVFGIDASPEMIARAKKKARKAGVDVVFTKALAQALPFPDAHFDVVLATMMLHHLGRQARQQCACEMRRVLKPGGRVLAVDFGTPSPKRSGLLGHLHRHGHVNLHDLTAVLSDAGLHSIESGAVGIKELQFVLATTG